MKYMFMHRKIEYLVIANTGLNGRTSHPFTGDAFVQELEAWTMDFQGRVSLVRSLRV